MWRAFSPTELRLQKRHGGMLCEKRGKRGTSLTLRVGKSGSGAKAREPPGWTRWGNRQSSDPWFNCMRRTGGTIRNSARQATIIAGANACSLLRRRGLTLIELTMVLLIMGILTAVAAPRLTSQLNQHSVGSVLSLIQTDLKAAQQEALTTSSSVTVSIDRLRNLYQVTADRGGTDTILKTVLIGDDPWNSEITSLLQGSERRSVDRIALTINGAGVFAESVVINLASGSATARATVDAATGRILVE